MQDTPQYPLPKGTKHERETFNKVWARYRLAKLDLDQRIQRKDGGFDESDRLWYGQLREDWPFETHIFDHQIRPALTRKTARMIGNKPKGRFVAREGSDELGAVVNNELFNFQWEDVSRIGLPMLTRWALMDQQTRRYGASFAVCKWHFEKRQEKTFFDGPDMQVIYARDVLSNPSYSEIKNWFQYREWTTLGELEGINDTSKSGEVWKNLDALRDSVTSEQFKPGVRRDTEYVVKGKLMRGLQDYLGRDNKYRIIEIVHEMRPDKWVTFAPKYGVVLREIDNPYDHHEIPVIQLKYDPNMDDIYGVSEVEQTAPHQRAINALLCADIDAIVQDLYPPIQIAPTEVRMHTIEWKPGAKWLVNRPGQSVIRTPTTTPGVREFTDAYALITASLNNALGETTAAFSQLQPINTERTASEIRSTEQNKNVYDNYNQIMLAECLKKQAYFWLEMNKQYLFSNPKDKYKIIRIVGRDAINFFQQIGLDSFGTDGPKFPVEMKNGTMGNKFLPGLGGQEGDLFLTKEDIAGSYDFQPDVESMQVASEQQIEAKLNFALQLLTNPTVVQLMAQEGKKPRITELVIKLLETSRVIKNAEQYFDNIQQGGGPQDGQSQANAGGGGPGGPGQPPGGPQGAGGMGGPPQALGGAPGQQLAGPPGV